MTKRKKAKLSEEAEVLVVAVEPVSWRERLTEGELRLVEESRVLSKGVGGRPEMVYCRLIAKLAGLLEEGDK